ncbi:MAG: hypothetical protein ACRDSR_23380 [Pseudonocardiaceae bacterium]
MSIMLPGELVEVMEVLGFSWPHADEDKIFECGRAWKDYAGEVERVIADADRACREAVERNRGESITAFGDHWRELGGEGDLRRAADAANIVSDALELFGNAVIAMKTATLVQLGIAAAAIIASVASAIFTAGLSTIAGGAAVQAARVAIRKIIDELIEKLVKTIIPKLKHEALDIFEKMTKRLRQYLGDLAGKLRQMLHRKGPDRNGPLINNTARKPPTHGTLQKRAGIKEGPVQLSPRKGASKEELEQYQEYIDAANRAKDQGQLSPTGRVKVDGKLKVDKEAAAAAERRSQERAGKPYGDDHAAHLPDTTWTGQAEPPQGWGRHTADVNRNIGSQSGRYPEGYKPTEFELGEPR